MKELSYEENVQALDACIGKLQREDIPLEESFKVYQEAVSYTHLTLPTICSV